MDELEYPPATMSYFCDLIRKDAERLSNLFEAENCEKPIVYKMKFRCKDSKFKFELKYEYVCAGKAALSLGSAEMAEHYFKTATEKDKNNGNIFFLLGYAQAMSGHSSKTVQSLTRALESNCDTSVKGQIYKMISMINTEQGDYGNALTNLSQAEDYIGLDYEILQQRAVCLLLCSAGLYPHDKRTFKRCGRCRICISERTCRGSRQNRLCGNTC